MSTKTYSPSQSRSKKWATVVTLIDQERFHGGPIDFGASYKDGTLDRVIASFEAVRDSIPEEYRASATCEIDSESGYEGSHNPRVVIKYERPATAEEIAAVEAHQHDTATSERVKELQTLATLKAKYD